MTRKILLTFDVEEFDLPEEYGIHLDKEQQLAVSRQGLDRVLEVLGKHNVAVTFFTTAYYAENNPDQMKALVANGHEVASHLYYHSDYNPSHILLSRQKLEEITNRPVVGFRTPRLRAMSPRLIKAAGYRYDSSLNPTYLPGRYNNYSKPRTWFEDYDNDLLVLPFSVSPVLRFPLFWLSFKNIYLPLYLWLCRQTLRQDGYLHLYFHPWEFTDLTNFKIPWYIKNRSGAQLIGQLDTLIEKMKGEGDFMTISQFFSECSFA